MATTKKKVTKSKKDEYVSFFELVGEDEEYVPQTKLVDKHGFYIGYTGRIVSFSILSILSLIAAYFAFNQGIDYKKFESYGYNENGSMDYQVYLKNNNYYETKYLESGMNYLTSLIDYFKINYNYTYVGNKDTEIKSNYLATGTLKVYDTKNGDKILFEKSYNLLPKKQILLNDKQVLEIKDSLDINYEYYNSIAKKYKRDFNLAATSDFKINIHVETILPEYDNEKTAYDYKMTIPLTEQTVNVTMEKNSIKNDKNIIHQEETTIVSWPFTILAGIATILGIILLVRAMKIILSAKTKKDPYSKKLNQILKDYDRAITITKTMIKVSPDDNVIDIATFEELLDIRDTLNVPILFNEIHKGQKSWFIIRKGSDVYKYVLKASELEPKPVKE